MNVSKALPIEFYLNGQVVYNDKTSPFMDFKKFFQKVGCDDEVKIQFTDTEQHSYILRFLDENDIEIDTVTFIQASYPGFYRYTASFTFQSLGICDQRVHLQIYTATNELSGSLTDLLEIVAGTLSVNQLINGAVTDLLEIRSGPPQATHLLVYNSDSFRLDTSAGSICGAGLITLYWGEGLPWGTGSTMYSDKDLSTLVTGFTFIVNEADGEIYNLDSGTGVVGSGTAVFC
jgi:hypothetical protein